MRFPTLPESTKELLEFLRSLQLSDTQELISIYTRSLTLLKDDLDSLYIFLDYISLYSKFCEVEEVEHLYSLFKVKMRKFKLFWVNYLIFQVTDRRKDFEVAFLKVFEYLKFKAFEGKDELVEELIKSKEMLMKEITNSKSTETNIVRYSFDREHEQCLNSTSSNQSTPLSITEYNKNSHTNSVYPIAQENTSVDICSSIMSIEDSLLNNVVSSNPTSDLPISSLTLDNQFYNNIDDNCENKVNITVSQGNPLEVKYKNILKLQQLKERNSKFISTSYEQNRENRYAFSTPKNLINEKTNNTDEGNNRVNSLEQECINSITLDNVNIEQRAKDVDMLTRGNAYSYDVVKEQEHQVMNKEINSEILVANQDNVLDKKEFSPEIAGYVKDKKLDKEGIRRDVVGTEQDRYVARPYYANNKCILDDKYGAKWIDKNNYEVNTTNNNQIFDKYPHLAKSNSNYTLNNQNKIDKKDSKLFLDPQQQRFEKINPNEDVFRTEDNDMLDNQAESNKNGRLSYNISVSDEEVMNSIRLPISTEPYNLFDTQTSQKDMILSSDRIFVSQQSKKDESDIKNTTQTVFEIDLNRTNDSLKPRFSPQRNIPYRSEQSKTINLTNRKFVDICAPIDRNPIDNSVLNTQKLNNVQFKDKVLLIINKIGKGGYSNVFKVVHNREIFALKQIRLEDQEGLNFCLDEIELLKKLSSCEYVVKMVDYEIKEDVVNILLECGEIDLLKLIKTERLSTFYIKYIWQSILKILVFIHSKRIVHRDIKPANFVLVKGKLKIIDFGISKSIKGDTTSILNIEKAGTLNYISPEQCGGRKVSRAADVWAAGCILYYMIYKKNIHNVKNVMDVLRVMTEEIEIHYGIADKSAIETIKACLVYDPKKRAKPEELLKFEFLK